MKTLLPTASRFESPAAYNAYVFSALLAGFSLVAVAVFTLIAVQTQAWQMWVYTLVTAAFGVTCVVAARWARANQPARSGWAVLTSMVVMAVAVNFVVANVAVLASVLIVLIGVLLVTQLLPREQLNAALFFTIIGALLAAFVSLFATPFQITFALLEIFVPALSAFLVIGFGVLIVRRFNSLPLSTKLLLVLLLVVGLSIGAVSVVTQQVVRDQLVAETGRNLQTVVRAKAGELAQLLELETQVLQPLTLNKFLQDFAEAASAQPPANQDEIQAQDVRWREAVRVNEVENPLITSVTRNEFAAELQEFQQQFPEHVEVFMTDKFGRNLASTAITTDYYQADEEWWQVAAREGVYIGQPELDESTGVIGLTIALAIPGHNREEIVGVLRTTLDQGVFQNLLVNGRFGETGEIEVFLPDDREFTLQEGVDGADQLALVEAEENVTDLRLATEAGAAYVEVTREDGPTTLSSLAPVAMTDATAIGVSRSAEALARAINNLQWLVVVGQERAEVVGVVDQAVRFTPLAGLIALAVAAAVALFIAQLITRPILRLTQVAARVTGGDLTAQAPVVSEDETGSLAMAFNVMTTQLRETLEGLEGRIADRTRIIATSAEVSRRLSTVLDRQKLVQEVVEQVQGAFGYYHSQIYFFDEAREHLVMAGGTGDAGQQMLARGHKIPAGRGLVGRAAETNTAVLVAETAKDPNWLPNPLLPATQAEAAVPIALGDRVLGVLDIQHDQAFGLDQSDVEVLQSLAFQVAIAYQNARAFSQAQRQADLEALANTIGQKLQAADSVEAALQVAAREVGRALGGVRTRVRLSPLANGQDQPVN